tara:strand:+ start:1352 stop:1603 length:252 start_codon:yes stop_codon:yes gene_type:complete
MRDKCVKCGEKSIYDKEEHIDFRIGYIEGAGQLCLDCYGEIYDLESKKVYEDMGDGHLVEMDWVRESFDTFSPYNDRWKKNER